MAPRARDLPTDFGKVRVGKQTLEDALLDLGSFRKDSKIYFDKRAVLKALAEKDLPTLRAISDYFYSVSGIYFRTCNYMAELFRYDWYLSTQVNDETAKEKICKEFFKTLDLLDNTRIKKLCGDIALEVIKKGCFYGYVIETDNGIVVQDLPQNYCRSRFKINGMPVVEFNMRFFDVQFPNPNTKIKILKAFPEEFRKGYIMYKEHKLPADNLVDKYGSWYALDPEMCVKFNINNSDIPLFVSAIPALIDLDAAQDLDRRRQMQQLIKLLIQKLPTDKNGDLIFDIDEAKDIHNTAVNMLQHTVGVDILTTFADIDAVNLSDKNTTATQDELEKVERTVFNALGISKNLLNADGNISMEKSVLDDESLMRNLVLQFEIFFDRIVVKRNSHPKKYKLHFHMLETTQYNYKEMAGLYKEQTAMGFSKMLPQIALGQSQSFILNSMYFENKVLELSTIMIPPLLSSTLNGEDILKTGTNDDGTSSNEGGRPAKSEDELSDKTIANKESAGQGG